MREKQLRGPRVDRVNRKSRPPTPQNGRNMATIKAIEARSVSCPGLYDDENFRLIQKFAFLRIF